MAQIKIILKNNNQFIGFNGNKIIQSSILIKNNNLHIDIIIDPKTKLEKLIKHLFQM